MFRRKLSKKRGTTLADNKKYMKMEGEPGGRSQPPSKNVTFDHNGKPLKKRKAVMQV